MDPDEDITLQWISLDEAQDMLDHGAIMDAKTIIALQHALSDDKKRRNSISFPQIPAELLYNDTDWERWMDL